MYCKVDSEVQRRIPTITPRGGGGLGGECTIYTDNAKGKIGPDLSTSSHHGLVSERRLWAALWLVVKTLLEARWPTSPS